MSVKQAFVTSIDFPLRFPPIQVAGRPPIQVAGRRQAGSEL